MLSYAIDARDFKRYVEDNPKHLARQISDAYYDNEICAPDIVITALIVTHQQYYDLLSFKPSSANAVTYNEKGSGAEFMGMEILRREPKA